VVGWALLGHGRCSRASLMGSSIAARGGPRGTPPAEARQPAQDQPRLPRSIDPMYDTVRPRGFEQPVLRRVRGRCGAMRAGTELAARVRTRCPSSGVDDPARRPATMRDVAERRRLPITVFRDVPGASPPRARASGRDLAASRRRAQLRSHTAPSSGSPSPPRGPSRCPCRAPARRRDLAARAVGHVQHRPRTLGGHRRPAGTALPR
jgi:hypothetical protein